MFGGRLAPFAKYSPSIAGAIEPFPCLLMDDGGLDLTSTLDWVDKGLADVDSVLSKRTPAVDWGREHWGARISAESVVIYSMHDESVDEILPTSAFKKALSAWRGFIAARPCAGSIQEVPMDA